MMIAPGLLEGVLGESFYTSPLRILDQEYSGSGSVAVNIDFRFHTTGSTPENKMSVKQVDNSVVLVPDQDQWKTDTITSAETYSLRHVSLVGDGTTVFDFPTINVWNTMANPSVFGMERPASGTEYITFRLEMADSTDTSTVLASALLTLRYTRT